MASSSLPWAWIIETLADSKPVSSNLLQVLVRSVPDFSNNSCEMTRERVSLKFLEELMESIPAGEIGNAPSSSGENVRFDVSERAMDVLLKVTSSDLMHGAELKHALSQFILHKRACLPKQALEQLKELILEGGHPSAPSLRERSGLAKENRARCLDNSRIPADSSGECETAKRLKVSNKTGEILSQEQNLPTVVPENVNKNLQEDAHTQISGSKQLASKQSMLVDDKEREPFLEDKVSNNDDNVQSMKQTTLSTDDGGKIPLEAQLNGALKTKDGDECIEVPETSCRSYGGRNTDLGYDLNDEMVAAEKHWFISSQNTVNLNSQAADCTEQSFCIKCDEGGQLLICSGSSCPIAVHESCLGSSVIFESTKNFYCPFCSYTRAHAAYRKAKQKFDNARKALSCFMGRNLVHPNQWKQPSASVPRKPSEAARNVDCPDKIHADQQHREIVNDHISMIGVEYQQQEKTSIDCDNKNLHHREAVSSLIIERNGNSLIQQKQGTVMTVDDNQCKTAVEQCSEVHVDTVCSNDNLPCNELNASIISERRDVSSINAERNHVEIVKDSQCIRKAEHQQQADPASVCNDGYLPCREAGTSLISEIDKVINGEEDSAEMFNDHQCINGRTRQKQPEIGTDCNIHNTPCIEVEASLTGERRARLRRKKAVIQEISDPHDHACLPNIDDIEETARINNEEDFSPNKRIKRRRAVKRYSNPLLPHMRRTKLRWTTEEEEMLKEAVQRLSKAGQRNLPWSKILEFGSKVFNKTRTPVDLKDKWRNIMIKEGSTAKAR